MRVLFRVEYLALEAVIRPACEEELAAAEARRLVADVRARLDMVVVASSYDVYDCSL